MQVTDINKVGVVGAGFMGHGIATVSALAGYPTMMHDVNEEILRRAMSGVQEILDIYIEENLIPPEQAHAALNNISTTTDLAKLAANSDFITEAIIERSAEKYKLFNALDKICPPHTIIVSNTSFQLLSDFARDVKRQDKIAITHYFSPAAFVPGVEVVRGQHTSDETFNITYELMKKWRKVPVKVLKEMPGHLINRLQRALTREGLELWAEGVASAEDIELAIKATIGFRMPHQGVMGHYDLAGMWRWPLENRLRMASHHAEAIPPAPPEIVEKIRNQYASGKPWFFPPEKFDEEAAKAAREYAHRLKDLYWSKDK